jgi:hypothetical protein
VCSCGSVELLASAEAANDLRRAFEQKDFKSISYFLEETHPPPKISSILVCLFIAVELLVIPLWSSGQSSWLQIQRSGFHSRRYQIFPEVVGLERGHSAS